MDVSNATLSPHADERMGRRRIDRDEVRQVLVAPDEILPARSGRVVAQKVLGRYLLRVFVDVDRTPPEGNRSRAGTGTGPFFGELSHLATHTLAENTDLSPSLPAP